MIYKDVSYETLIIVSDIQFYHDLFAYLSSIADIFTVLCFINEETWYEGLLNTSCSACVWKLPIRLFSIMIPQLYELKNNEGE